MKHIVVAFIINLIIRTMKSTVRILLAFVAFLPAKAQEHLPVKPQSHPIEIVVHRGANHLAPENTKAAAEKCIEMGLDYVEIDIRQSKDGVFYIMHDETVDRTTNGKGKIRDLTAAQINKLDAGSWFSNNYKGEKVPELEQYLKWIKGKAKVYLDVKDADIKRLVALVKDLKMEEELFFWFGDSSKANEFSKLAPELKLKVNANTKQEVEAVISKFSPDIIECGVESVGREFINFCHQKNLKVMVYTPQNTPEDFQKVIASEADMINLDEPVLYLNVLKEIKQNN